MFPIEDIQYTQDDQTNERSSTNLSSLCADSQRESIAVGQSRHPELLYWCVVAEPEDGSEVLFY